jgi:isopenicillin-N N-acyltransferase like protein
VAGNKGDAEPAGKADGDVMTTADVAVIDLNGDPHQRGLQHGLQAADAIQAFLNDGLTRLDAFLPEHPTLDRFEAELSAYGRSIREQAPDIFREIEGLADGAGISLPQAMLLQVRRELAGFSRFATAGDCTTFARTSGKPVLGQTVDLAGDMDEQLTLLRVRDRFTGHRALVLSFTGLLGYLGVNDRGLAVGINLVLGGDWKPGLPPYLAIRHLLDTCASVEGALDRLGELDLASSRCFMLCDGSSAAYAELLDGRLSVRRGSVLSHTNHFLDPDFAALDDMNVFARNGSRKRLDACSAWLRANLDCTDPEACFDLFTSAPVCVPDSGDRSVEKTVAAVVLDPVDRVLYVRPGNPRYSTTRRFEMLAA